MCDSLRKIRGVVDYQKWQSSTIDLYLPHFEFCDRESLSCWKRLQNERENDFLYQEEMMASSLSPILMELLRKVTTRETSVTRQVFFFCLFLGGLVRGTENF